MADSGGAASPSPLVSVVIATHRRPDYLRVAISSALAQTYPNIEIIVSDDASPEDPSPIVRSFGDPRIRLIRHEHNVGIAANVTGAMMQAEGAFVANLHDDDAWEPEFLTELVRPLLAHPDAALSFADYWIVDAAGNVEPEASDEQTRIEGRAGLERGIKQPFLDLAVVDQSVFIAAAAVIRRGAIDWHEAARGGVLWDYYSGYLAGRDGRAAWYEPQRLTRYRRHGASETMISGSRDANAKVRKAEAAMFIYEQLMADPELAHHRELFAQRWVTANTSKAIAQLRLGDSSAARAQVRASMERSRDRRTLVTCALAHAPRPIGRWLSSELRER
jgi:glycosyltransferase involved in cell wall biosynthesis